jgi:hypothetical protein
MNEARKGSKRGEIFFKSAIFSKRFIEFGHFGGSDFLLMDD